jgi:hypothetical protein
MKYLYSGALFIGVAAAGYALGARRPDPTALVRDKTPPTTTAEERPITRADIAAAVRAELAQLPETLRINAPAAAAASGASNKARLEQEEESEGPPPNPSNPEARARAEAVVNDAIHFARWTDHDRTLLREQLSQLHGDEWLAVTTPLAAAINSDKVVVETRGIPF